MKSALRITLAALIVMATVEPFMAASLGARCSTDTDGEDPKCSPKVYTLFPKGSSPNSAPFDWWQKTVVYQIYPRSFSDSNGDGVGDLKGIENKLDYFKTIGVDAVWLSPIYRSPMKDFGYDISDFKDVDPLFGNMHDLVSLISMAKRKGIKIILDFVPNHSSNLHEWFLKSRQREEPYTDYYIWKDGKGPDKKQPPNNWLSVFGGSAWTYDDVRGQFYFHQFLKEQPDLNYRNPAVRKEMENVIRFWLDRGVDGFRVDAYHFTFEDIRLLDEPLSHNPDALPNESGYLSHIYTQNQPECFDLLADWQKILRSYEAKDNHHRLLMLEIYLPLNDLMEYYGNSTQRLSDFPFNFELIKLNSKSTALDAHKLVSGWLDAVTPIGKWSNWVLGNHDQPRVSSRVNPQLKDGLNMLTMLLPGTGITYYGEEIGMEDIEVSWEDTQDPAGKNAGKDRYKKFSRDPQRSPMQWNQDKNAGFSSAAKTWLPVNPDYKTINVETELAAERSHLKVYMDLLHLRKEATIMRGSVQFPLVSESLYTSLRMLENHLAYLTVINWGEEPQNVDFSKALVSGFQFPDKGVVAIASTNVPDESPFLTERIVSLKDLTLGPYQSLVIKFNPIYE